MDRCVEKKRIKKGLKAKVWFREFDRRDEGECPVIHCTERITKYKFEAGHIISELNGGPTTLKNLRPICKNCNCQMSSTNWKEFEESEY